MVLRYVLCHTYNIVNNLSISQQIKGFLSYRSRIKGKEIIIKAIELFPNDGRNYSVLGYFYTNEGNSLKDFRRDSLFSIAENYFNESSTKTPEYSYQYFQWAILKFYKDEYYSSWELIEEAKNKGEKEIDSKLVKDLEAKLPYKSYLKQKTARQ